jgi:hypothetical protein
VGKTQNFAVLYGAGPTRSPSWLAAPSAGAGTDWVILRYVLPARAWKYRELQVARSWAIGRTLGRIRHGWSSLRSAGSVGCRCSSSSRRTHIRFHAERQAINALCQGFAAYVTKLAMVELNETLPKGAR